MHLSKKILISLLLMIPFGLAQALDKEPFTQERFDELQASGEAILVDIYATWCPVCAKQREILEEFQAANPNNDLHILEVNFDDQKDVVRQFRAPRQSTLILYKGTEQVWFGVAETREDIINAQIDNALATEAN